MTPISHSQPSDDLFPRAKQILLPIVADNDDREALLIDAFYLHDPLLHGIELKGAAGPFASRLIKKLLDYGCLPGGEHALARLLATVRYSCDVDKHAEIDGLIRIVNGLSQSPAPQHPRVTTPATRPLPIPVQTIRTPRDERRPTVFISYTYHCKNHSIDEGKGLNFIGGSHSCSRWVR